MTPDDDPAELAAESGLDPSDFDSQDTTTDKPFTRVATARGVKATARGGTKEPRLLAPPSQWDKIYLKDMRFYGYHGVYAHEQANGQPFEVDLEMEIDLSGPARDDDLTQTVHYGSVHAKVKKVMEGRPRRLLETLSLDIIHLVMETFPTIHSVRVQVRKPKVALKGHLSHAAVEMFRERRGEHAPTTAEFDAAEVGESWDDYTPEDVDRYAEHNESTHQQEDEEADWQKETVAEEEQEEDELNGKVQAGIFRRPAQEQLQAPSSASSESDVAGTNSKPKPRLIVDPLDPHWREKLAGTYKEPPPKKKGRK